MVFALSSSGKYSSVSISNDAFLPYSVSISLEGSNWTICVFSEIEIPFSLTKSLELTQELTMGMQITTNRKLIFFFAICMFIFSTIYIGFEAPIYIVDKTLF